jgi:hypothetical protein
LIRKYHFYAALGGMPATRKLSRVDIISALLVMAKRSNTPKLCLLPAARTEDRKQLADQFSRTVFLKNNFQIEGRESLPMRIKSRGGRRAFESVTLGD